MTPGDYNLLTLLVLDRIQILADMRETEAEVRWRGLYKRLCEAQEASAKEGR